MTILQVKGVAKGFNQLLFNGVDLQATTPNTIGLIDDNGCGKSTFLKMLAGLEDVPDGMIQWKNDIKIGYLEQEITSDTFDVSGGEKKILRLIELFYGNYDVLLLDEPDNHLDLDHKIWFEQMVKEFPGLIIVISHDRRFLSDCIKKVWLVEENKIREYPFGYDKFKDLYLKEMEDRQQLWLNQEKERIRLKDIVRRLGDQAAANDKFVGRYHNAEKRYDRFVRDMVEKPPSDKSIKFKVNIGELPKRKTAIHLKDVNKDYDGNEVLKNTNLHVFCKEKISINAPNGSGKSTLLNIISGRLEASSGEVSIGPNLNIGYYAQEHLQVLDEHATLVEELQKSASFTFYDAIAYLKRFLFTDTQTQSEVRFLSGGQKSRLQLAKFLATNPEILILDEPTNHLDIKTVIALESFLTAYEGTLILVSHDRELVEKTTSKQYPLRDGVLVKEIN